MLNKHLLSLPWKESGLLCHNTMFDGAISGLVFEDLSSYIS
jgi:hypothetical protein